MTPSISHAIQNHELSLTKQYWALTHYGIDASDAAIRAMQGRMCLPEEVANAALFLLSDEASFVNGTHLFVDNGFTAM